MEVDGDGKLLASLGGARKEVAEPEVPGGVDGDVGCGDAVNWLVGGGDFEINEVNETAVDGAITSERSVCEEPEGCDEESDLPWKIRRPHFWRQDETLLHLHSLNIMA